MSETTKPERVYPVAQCPFCGQSMYVRRGVNPSARCDTEDCWMAERSIAIPLDDPRQLAQWNKRPEAQPPAAPSTANEVTQEVPPRDSEALRPCPSCKSADIRLIDGAPGCSWIVCRGCGLQTDDGFRGRRITQWNDLPRASTANEGEAVVRPSWSEFAHGDAVEVVRKRESAPEFPGFVIGWYERLDGARGYVLQHDPHRIVHVNPVGSVIARAALTKGAEHVS
jgi:hypothetical protein